MDRSTARKILGVSEAASFEETRHRFRALAKSHHPDLNPGKDSASFVLVSAAYLVLQGREAGISKNEDALDYASYAALLHNGIGQYFDGMVNSFIQSIGAFEKCLLAVWPSGGETLHAVHSDDGDAARSSRSMRATEHGHR